MVWSHSNAAAEVKKMDPTKKTIPSTADPTACSKPGNGPMKKQTEPMANRTPIHQVSLLGAHQTPDGGGTR
jgi:hypothetical protein